MKNIFYSLFVVTLLASCVPSNEMKLTVKNPSSFDRSTEIVEIPVEKIKEKITLADGQVYVVKNTKGEVIPSQETYDRKLIFQSGVEKGSAEYSISAGAPQQFKSQTFGRFITERKDDFAWENDRVAFRIYGPALVAIDGPSNGIDAWYKRTNELIIDKWYKDDLAGKQSYHEDHGEGLDDYKVGRSLGIGAMAPFVNGTLWLNENFTTEEVLENGPLRTTAKFTYNNIDVDGKRFSETRTISIDAGCQLSKITQEYGTSEPIKVAAGIPLRNDSPELITVKGEKNGYSIYTEPSENAGDVFMAIVFPTPLDTIQQHTYVYNNPKNNNKSETHTHILNVATYQPNAPITYYSGYGWTKFGFENQAAFDTYIKNFCESLEHPLIIKY